MSKKTDDTLAEARKRFDLAYTADLDNRDEALDDLRFYAGEQWPEDVKRDRESQGRPCITINMLPQFVRQIVGDMRQNKPSIKVLPVDGGADVKVAALYSGLIRHIEQQSDAVGVYQTAGEHAAICGMGHFRIVSDYAADDVFDQDLFIRRVTDPFAVYWDPSAVEPDRSDAEWCFVTERMSKEAFKKRFPKANMTDWDGGEITREGGLWFDGDLVRVAEYWTRTTKTKRLLMLPNGQVVDATDMTDDDIAALGPVRERIAKCPVVTQCLLSGTEVLEKPVEWPGRYIPVVPVLGEEVNIGERTVRHGAIRYAKDPQRLFNYAESAKAEYGSLQVKAPYIVSAAQIKGLESRWANANNANQPYLVYNPDGQSPPPMRQQPPVGSPWLSEMAADAAENMKRTTGIYDAALGARSNETSGKAIALRQQESDVGTSAYADNLARAIRRCGNILIDLIPHFYDGTRTARVLGEDDTPGTEQINVPVRMPDGSVAYLNDLSIGRYDVMVSTGPSYSTKRQQAADGMTQLLAANPELWMTVGDILVRNLDWPGADKLAERLKRMVPPQLLGPDDRQEEQQQPQQQGPSPEQQAMAMQQQAAQMDMQMKAEKAAAEIEKVRADTAKVQAEIETQQLKSAEIMQRMRMGAASQATQPEGAA